MKTRTTLYAEEGMILTNGEVYGSIIHLAIGEDESIWHEITKEEYDRIIESQEKVINNECY